MDSEQQVQEQRIQRVRDSREILTQVLEASLTNTRDNIFRHKLQQNRMPFDHDNNAALERQELREKKLQAALIAILEL